MRFPQRPSPLRKTLLAPLALAYGAAAAAHRALWLRPRAWDRTALPPLGIIGSLRAGGAGKTAVTLALAQAMREDGRRVGILVYGVHRRGSGAARRIVHEVAPDSDWRDSSDEAVLLARESGARVFATRDRDRAWEALGHAERFDILLSDDGLMDSRLQGAHRLALIRPGENPGWTDLLPAGPYRLPASSLSGVDGILRADVDFVRKPLLPDDWEPERSYWVLCGLGDPSAFARALRAAGARIAGCSAGPDHGLPDLKRAREDARRAGVDRFLCSAKDWIKLEGRIGRPERLLRVGERVTFSTGALDSVRGLVSRHATSS
jgi:tetraacyldisaccharide-1-P 4'-kinase